MNHLALSCLLTFAATSITSLFILFHKPQTTLKKSWAGFNTLVALWSFELFVSSYTNNKELSLFSYRACDVIAIFIPVVFFHFTLLVCESFEKHKLELKNYLIISIAYFFIATTLPNLFIPTVIPKLTFNYYPIAGPTYYFFPILYSIVVVRSLYLLANSFKTSSLVKKNQNKYIFWGMILGFIGGGSTFLLVFDIPVYPYPTYLVPIYNFIVGYAIIKHELLDIRIVIKKSIIYTLLITSLTLVFFVFVYITERVFQNIFGYNSLLISIVAAALITLIFIPLRNTIQNFIDTYFFKGTYLKIAEENERLRQDMAEKEKFKAVATLASGMAHEIRNPLQAIKTFSEYLPGKLDDKEFLLKFSRIANDEVNRIDRLIQQMLNFSRPSTPLKEKTDMAGLINDTLMFLDSKFIAGRVRVVKDFCAEPPALEADPNQIRQALMNIFLNAIDAMPDGGTLNVAIHPLDHYLLIRIADTGKGIAATDLPHIFDPFFTRKDHGTGLGLAVTKGIIHEHGGEISVESRNGQGITFTLRLPLPSKG